jgi:hypothetical protein
MSKQARSIFLFALIFLTGLFAQAADKIVFVINTKENDVRGAVTATYLDEYADIQNWQKLYPAAKVIRIRANTNSELTKLLGLWMQADGGDKEVVGLFVRSHGEPLKLFNEAETFSVRLPEDVASVFSPIVNHFAPDARIVFNGCTVLQGKTAEQAAESLKSIVQAFGAQSGIIYANRTYGFESLNAYLRDDLTNKDIPMLQRTSAGVFYVAWPITVPMIYAMTKMMNRGYLLRFGAKAASVYKTDYFTALKPDLGILK